MSCYHYLNLYCPVCGKLIDKQNYVLKGKQKVCMDYFDKRDQSYKRLEKYFRALRDDKLDEYYKDKEKGKNKTLEV